MTVKNWVIEGVMEDGGKFRPSDWVERLSGALASFGPDHRLKYGSVRPFIFRGQKCLLVQEALEKENPSAFAFVKDFALSNHLRICDLESRKKPR